MVNTTHLQTDGEPRSTTGIRVFIAVLAGFIGVEVIGSAAGSDGVLAPILIWLSALAFWLCRESRNRSEAYAAVALFVLIMLLVTAFVMVFAASHSA